ncbi:TetR family transcriptional regulator [Roseomonas sp. OT10]|uniref:TetR family transcriptional regulator n=1 Tax=Roseomonas cutis TaxID=2897332 RepID=UPI001E4A60D7|nr:TetR family transcriptional regulator [Roseomonas sp. OT10]UFN50887.1 TetR family transcriptional regulator [Roseomonas sp. OT10]
MQNDPAIDPDALNAFWRVVAEHGWHGVSFRRVAQGSGRTLEALRARYASPMGLLREHTRAVDRQVLAGTLDGQGGSVRDRLFDLLMRRFDALQPNRAGILRLRSDMRRDPLLALALWPQLLASMAWMLEGAEVDTAGPKGLLRVKGLAAVWLAAAQAWAKDESPDLGQTMAALDKALDRAEGFARRLRLDDGDLEGGTGRDSPDTASTEAAAGSPSPGPAPFPHGSPAPPADPPEATDPALG